MRTHVKKKAYQVHVRANTLAGQITTPEGNWITAIGGNDAVKAKNVLEGTRGKAGRKGRRRKSGNAATE